VSHFFCKALQSCNLPAARELFKPYTNSASLPVETEKKFFSLWIWGFLDVTSQWGHVCKFLATFSWPWAPTHWPIFWLKVLLKTRSKSASLEPLIDLHFCSQNYGSKTQFLTKFKTFLKRHNLPSQGKLWPAITRPQIELESCPSPVMTRGVV